MANFRIGDEVQITSDNDNYENYIGRILIVTDIAKSTSEHLGYDTEVGGQLIDMVVKGTNEEVPYSLYDWELKKV